MKKILVVDNDRIVLKFMTRLLENEGHQVLAEEDGLKALDTLKTFTPDFIFVDLIMPNIDGETLCNIIRDTPKLRDTFLVVLSAIAAEEWVDIAKLGADACIAKGPLNEMGQHVLFVIDQPEIASSQALQGNVFGLSEIRPRGITKELLRVKRHFAVILERMTEGILEINAEGRIVYANTKALSLIEMKEKDLLGSLFTGLFAGDDYSRVIDFMKMKGQNGAKTPDDAPLRLNRYQVALNIQPLDKDESKSIIILHDVSERRQAEIALRESEENYRFLTENIIDIVWILDRDFRTTYVSPSIEKVLGFTPEERKRQRLEEMITPESIQRVQERFMEELGRDEERTADPDRSIIIEVEYYHKNGGTVWMENSVKAIRNPEGAIVGMHGVSRNIAERKRAEKEREELIEKLRESLAEVQTLSGLLPICSSCKKIRDDRGYWNQIESFIKARSGADFSHSICPECAKKLYPELDIHDD